MDRRAIRILPILTGALAATVTVVGGARIADRYYADRADDRVADLAARAEALLPDMELDQLGNRQIDVLSAAGFMGPSGPITSTGQGNTFAFDSEVVAGWGPWEHRRCVEVAFQLEPRVVVVEDYPYACDSEGYYLPQLPG